MHPEFSSNPEHVAQIKREWADYQQRHGLWPRGHWHAKARAERRAVTDFCPPLREMADFLAPGEVVPVGRPVAESRKGRRAAD